MVPLTIRFPKAGQREVTWTFPTLRVARHSDERRLWRRDTSPRVADGCDDGRLALGCLEARCVGGNQGIMEHADLVGRSRPSRRNNATGRPSRARRPAGGWTSPEIGPRRTITDNPVIDAVGLLRSERLVAHASPAAAHATPGVPRGYRTSGLGTVVLENLRGSSGANVSTAAAIIRPSHLAAAEPGGHAAPAAVSVSGPVASETTGGWSTSAGPGCSIGR